MKWRNGLINLAVVVGVAAGVFFVLQAIGPKATPIRHGTTNSARVTPLRLVGLGDSLTHGVGDDTNSGGYVPLIKTDMEKSGQYTVSTQNFGVTGNTASQVQSRLNQQPKLQKAIQQADVITLTVGGNDLMAVLQKHFLDITKKQVTAGNQAFQKRLVTLLETLRRHNQTAPIYVFGIYNPFYVYFPTLTAMTDSVTAWNQATKATVKKFKRAYYVDIDRVLTKGPTQTVKQATKDSLEQAVAGDKDANPLIFSEDHFHPNNAGYAAMTRQLWQVMQKTKGDWEK